MQNRYFNHKSDYITLISNNIQTGAGKSGGKDKSLVLVPGTAGISTVNDQSKNNKKYYYIHDNGGRPFKVQIKSNNKVIVHAQIDYDEKKRKCCL